MLEQELFLKMFFLWVLTVWADMERGCNFSIRFPLYHIPDNLQLPRCKKGGEFGKDTFFKLEDTKIIGVDIPLYSIVVGNKRNIREHAPVAYHSAFIINLI